jgi:putative ATP-binding cassette transporter
MDEATSALDEVSEAKMMEFLRTDLARVTVIGVARRSGLDEYFEREITLRRSHGLARATVRDLQGGTLSQLQPSA